MFRVEGLQLHASLLCSNMIKESEDSLKNAFFEQFRSDWLLQPQNMTVSHSFSLGELDCKGYQRINILPDRDQSEAKIVDVALSVSGGESEANHLFDLV